MRLAASPSSGRPTLVLLPGLLCDDEVWSAQRAALEDRFELVVGRPGELNRLDHMARDVLEHVTAPRFALAGHSMGGRVALEVMRLAPHRVTRLALLDTGTAPLAQGRTGEDERRGRLDLLALARREGMAAMGRQWARPMVHPDVVGSALFERIVAMVARSTPARMEAQIEALLHRPDAADVLRAVRCPLLLLCGREDQWSPPARHQAMQALVPGSTLCLIEHCGHMSPMEQPQAVSKALATWLAQEACDER
jgi:pimeloyl-ACP methyl ester carboxylesterase